MKSRQTCEICKTFTVVGFTDCGRICEACFSKELQLNAYNYAIEQCIKTIEKLPLRLTPADCIKAIEPLKKKEHKKESV